MREHELHLAVEEILLHNPKPGKRRVLALLEGALNSKSAARRAVRALNSSRLLWYLPNACSLGYSMLLAEFESESHILAVQQKASLSPFLVLKTPVGKPKFYAVYSVPAFAAADAASILSSAGVNVHFQSGLRDCYSLDPLKKPALVGFAKQLCLEPLLSVRKLSERAGVNHSTGKFFYRELERRGFFSGHFVLRESRYGRLLQFAFLSLRGFEEVELPESILAFSVASFAHERDLITLSFAIAVVADDFFPRASEIFGKYDIDMSNFFSIPPSLTKNTNSSFKFRSN